MDVKDFTKQSGFLRADDIKTRPNGRGFFVILQEGELVDNERFKKIDLHLRGDFYGKEIIFNCNKTNARKIEETTKSSDTRDWVGKVLALETVKTRTGDGKVVDGMNIYEVLNELPTETNITPAPAQAVTTPATTPGTTTTTVAPVRDLSLPR